MNEAINEPKFNHLRFMNIVRAIQHPSAIWVSIILQVLTVNKMDLKSVFDYFLDQTKNRYKCWGINEFSKICQELDLDFEI